MTTAAIEDTLCLGGTVNVSFDASGTFLDGNVFTAELSDAAGSFASPVIIGALSSTASGTINAAIPPNTDIGGSYRIRVVSSNPAIEGTDNGADITIQAALTWYADTDADGFGNAANWAQACEQPVGYVANSIDCDDADGDVWSLFVVYVDSDVDGYHSDTLIACFGNVISAPFFLTTYGPDCDDTNPAVWRREALYLDADDDGYDAGVDTVCYGQLIPFDYSSVSDGRDCDDTNPAVWRRGPLYFDSDEDGYDAGVDTVCYGQLVPAGYTSMSNGSDCDDADGFVWREASLYLDADEDGYTAGVETICYGANVPEGYSTTTNGSDCNDAQILYADFDGDGFGAGAPAACGVGNDSDCDDTVFLYSDLDGDGYGSGDPVPCGVPNGTDWDDNDPGAGGIGDPNESIPPGGIPVSIENLGHGTEDGLTLSLFPNPTSGIITLNSTAQRQPHQITVCDATGCAIQEHTVNFTNGTFVLDLSNNASGLYLVQVRFTDGLQAIRCVMKE